jgi:hypothetical protein
MLLIPNRENEHTKRPEAEARDLMTAYQKYTEELRKAGVMVHADALHMSDRGARVHVEGGKRTVVDGPFTESKELIGGYFIIDVKSKDEAVEWAAKCPGARYWGVEVRELMNMG